MSLSLSISTMPVHVVVWQDAVQQTTYVSSNSTFTQASNVNQNGTVDISELCKKIMDLEKKVEKLTVMVKISDDTLNEMRKLHEPILARRISDILSQPQQKTIAKSSPYFTATSVESPVGLEILTPSVLSSGPLVVAETPIAFKKVVEDVSTIEKQLSEVKKQEAEEEEVEEEEVEEEEVEEEEVEEEEAEEEEVEEEEGVKELDEFEYKGTTYYRDSDNLVYQLDEDGDLDDTPIGVWNKEKQKILKYKV